MTEKVAVYKLPLFLLRRYKFIITNKQLVIGGISIQINFTVFGFAHVFEEHENLDKEDNGGNNTHSRISAGLTVLADVKHFSEDETVDQQGKNREDTADKRNAIPKMVLSDIKTPFCVGYPGLSHDNRYIYIFVGSVIRNDGRILVGSTIYNQFLHALLDSGKIFNFNLIGHFPEFSGNGKFTEIRRYTRIDAQSVQWISLMSSR